MLKHAEALTHDESVEIVSRWMRHKPFGFEGVFSASDIRLVTNKVAVVSEGWPLHIATHLSLLGQEVLKQRDVPNAGIDLDAILDRGSEDKIRYCERCLSTADLGDYARVICDAGQKSEKNIVEFKDLHDVATTEYGIDSSDVYALHKKTVKAGVFDDLVSSPMPDEFKFSTPGFRTYMSVARDPAPFKATMRQQMDLTKC